MGNNSKFLHSKQDQLYYYIERSDYHMVQQMLMKEPELLERTLTKDSKHTPLMRAIFRGDIKMIDLMLKKKANVNQMNSKEQTAIILAIVKNQLQIVKKLIYQQNAKVDYVTKAGLCPLDYAILPGFYEIAKIIYEKSQKKTLKSVDQYRSLAKRYSYRFVEYSVILKSLSEDKNSQNIGNFLRKEKKKMQDPVIDPRETWKQWALRVYEFRDAPLVQRQNLPEELQPQNRLLGQFHHYIDKLARNPQTQKSRLRPSEKQLTEIGNIPNQETRSEFIDKQERRFNA